MLAFDLKYMLIAQESVSTDIFISSPFFHSLYSVHMYLCVFILAIVFGYVVIS